MPVKPSIVDKKPVAVEPAVEKPVSSVSNEKPQVVDVVDNAPPSPVSGEVTKARPRSAYMNTKMFQNIVDSKSAAASPQPLVGNNANANAGSNRNTVASIPQKIVEEKPVAVLPAPVDLKAARVSAIVLAHETEKDYIEALDSASELLFTIENSGSKQFIDLATEVLQDIECVRLINKDFFNEFDSKFNQASKSSTIYDLEIGKIMLKRAPTFRIYKTYASAFHNNLTKVKDNAEFLKFCNENTPQKSIENLLMRPMLRIANYLQAFKSLQESTPKEHPDYSFTMNMIDQLQQIQQHILSKQKEQSQLEVLRLGTVFNGPSQPFVKFYVQERLGFPVPHLQPQLAKYLQYLEKKNKKADKYTKQWQQIKDVFVTQPNGDVVFKLSNPADVQKVQQRVRRCGIPPAYRPSLWLQLSGAAKKLKENEGYYEKMLQIHSKQLQSRTYEEIEKDLLRTYPTHPLFETRGETHNSMARILVAYSWRNPLVAYCQSFNFIVGLLLLHFSEEEVCAFVVV